MKLQSLLNDNARKLQTMPYWIAEPAYSHQGEILFLHHVAEQLGQVKPNAVKFHIMLDLEEYMVPNHSLYPVLAKWLFTKEQWRAIFQKCHDLGMEIIGLADELPALEFLIEEKVDAIAIHAASINDKFILKRLAEVEQPLFIGIGGIDLTEISYALNMLSGKSNIIMMYGIQHYPTPLEDIHLGKLTLYRNQFQCHVGYADHTENTENLNRMLMYAVAYGLGSRIFEQHITIDLKVKREDDESAIEIKDFAQLRDQIQVIVSATGFPDTHLMDTERSYFSKVRKCMVAAHDLPVGLTIREQDIKFKRTGWPGDLEQQHFLSIIGKSLQVPIGKGNAFTWSHFGIRDRRPRKCP